MHNGYFEGGAKSRSESGGSVQKAKKASHVRLFTFKKIKSFVKNIFLFISIMKIALMVLVGLPGSGKTTLAKNLIKNDNKNYSYVHVCYDDLISRYDLNWKGSRKTVSDNIHKLVSSVKNTDFEKCPSEFQNQLKNVDIKNNPLVIIVDDNMYYKSMRYVLYQISQKEEISFCQIFMKCPVEVALRNNKSREAKVPADIIIEMSKSIEIPNKENKWERHSVILNQDNFYKDIFNILENCLSDPETHVNLDEETIEKELSASITLTNIIHQVDIALRHILSKKMKSHNDKEHLAKTYATELNTKRKEYLNSLKKDEVTLPDEILEEIQHIEIREKSKLLSYLEERFS